MRRLDRLSLSPCGGQFSAWNKAEAPPGLTFPLLFRILHRAL